MARFCRIDLSDWAPSGDSYWIGIYVLILFTSACFIVTLVRERQRAARCLGCTLVGLIVLGFATPIVLEETKPARVRTPSCATPRCNNIKQIALSFHNYESAHGTLPDDIRDKDGNALLSWRVRILPFIESETHFKQFKLDEPWNSPHNLALLPTMPAYFESTKTKVAPGHTFIQAFKGERAAFRPGKPWRIADIPDGSSMTIAIVEAGVAVPWTKPADIDFHPGCPEPRLGYPQDDTFLAGLLDGSVRSFTKKKLRWDLMQAWITPDGNEEVREPTD